jgi:hypothetical protein
MANCPYMKKTRDEFYTCDKPDSEDCPEDYGPTTDCEFHKDYWTVRYPIGSADTGEE